MKTTTKIDENTGDKHITVDIGSKYTYGDWTLYKIADIEAQLRKTPGCDLEGYVLKEGTQLLAKHLGKSVGTYVFSKNKTETAPVKKAVSVETAPVKKAVSKTKTSRKKKSVTNKEG
mgnify:CR=1 FL=1|tara:strand:+ start:135 stop:485 length:351 start_codon:yes stop_codon:yes gene_type:complete